ncbi:snoRNA-binding rRNA-processing protein utp10 [Yamadazyma tenuis]|uniref:U3 small nucleolar RNA-associated protein 10 n=1 Tax=Candida tenuis (strain ATCC 10573 / BCRC 21748 / CBS 615 / JCM 9827 / NBRC 10315 / NRRL Y-1498 / VKM Y-70) TaxID=590646 RepID=G3B8D4_CANTC|nr:uncharacterized protein CANTEDRAFT_99380 [Yamadazyma tenuis ATCC 10573]EGV62372.1 hypothetical protein CANTEDRAFT_99380 [Yamadazyma tenuis ATCC 10573]WEJ93637.1 snoRNA-binding rRNA-processing protein utp10 [Yamadazyma tenuis]
MSLSEQLGAIADRTASVVVDRKTRSKIHSKSLIFEPKVASTQDYELIYQIGLEGLEELSSIDRRFVRFENTLFSETAINFDRNTQSQPLLKDLNESINSFLLLVSPYLNLNCSIKALEWLVRKFNINMFNGELLLLIGLSYYKEPVFLKFLNVIPKNSFPKIFEPLAAFKDLLKNPSAASILKSFLNNLELVQLYFSFIVDQVKNKLIFKSQLVFYLSISIQLLSANSKDSEKLEQNYVPLVLNAVGYFLLPNDTSLSHELKLTAFSLVSVLSSILPLNSKVVLSLTDSIINNDECLNDKIIKKTLITLGQLWHGFVTDERIYVKPFDLASHETLVTSVVKENFNCNKFLIAYYISNTFEKGLYRLIKHINVDNQVEFKTIMNALLVETESSEEDTKTNVTRGLESLYKSNSSLFKENLKCFREGFSLSDLEMVLMTTLDDGYIRDSDQEFEVHDDADDEDDEESIEIIQQKMTEFKISHNTTTFWNSSSTEEFNNLATILMKNLNATSGLVTKFTSMELYISFLFRFSLTPSIPIIARLSVLKTLNHKMNKLVKYDYEFYTLLPFVLLGLFDQSKLVRQYYLSLFKKFSKANPSKKAELFMEEEIYGSLPKNKRSILSPKDGNYLIEILDEANLEDVTVDQYKLVPLVNSLFNHSKGNSKKFGANYLKGFVLNQWSLPYLPLCFKYKIWNIMSVLNNEFQPNDFREAFVENDLSSYLSTRNNLVKEANEIKVEFANVEKWLVSILGGRHINDKFAAKEVDITITLILGPSQLQELISERMPVIFEYIKSSDLKFKIVTKLIDCVINDTNSVVDQFEVLSNLKLDFQLISSVLSTVQLNEQVPEQAIVKRKRRSSSQTKQTMARSDINSMASTHLRKLTIILDYLEINLTDNLKANVQDDTISRPELLVELFKILTDLDYLGNDGHLPVLYAQETLASCMLMSIKSMKSKNFTFDSNSIRADLIVNSIRNSTSPQVQNRLLLVIAELASLAPEIILHSVMPIFTFMGAHTIKQDDEFSNSALQETVSRVIPALAQNGTTNIDEDIEFLLASFVAALQHIPRHRRNKLFNSLVKTLTVEKSLHTILFLVGNQLHKLDGNQVDTKNSLVEFSSSLVKNFSADEQLNAINKLLLLWDKIPNQTVEKNSEEYASLIKRPIFGASLLSLTNDELINLKVNLLNFVNEIIDPTDDFNEINLLKLKINLKLLDQDISGQEKESMLQEFNQIISFLLKSIDAFSNKKGIKSGKIISNIYRLLNGFLDMLPISYFIDSIVSSLNPDSLNDFISIKIAINFANLTSVKFENDLNINNVNDELKETIKTKLLPVLITGIDKNLGLVLQQSYLDTFAVVIQKLAAVDPEAFNDSKSLLSSLNLVISDKGFLSDKPELIISATNVIINVINILGIKFIGCFPKVIKPSFQIWEKYQADEDKDEEDEEAGSSTLVRTSILLLYSALIKKLPAFLGSHLEHIIITILNSNEVDNGLRSEILSLLISHVELSVLLKSLISIWNNKKFYDNNHTDNLGLYLRCLEYTIESIDKKTAVQNSTLFLRWILTSFEFRQYCESNDKFNNNTIHRLEASFHKCGMMFIMKLNDKSFRPLFASLTRWAINGEDSTVDSEVSRYTSFFKFFNKMQEELKSIVTSYYSYVIEAVAQLLQKFAASEVDDINLRRIVLISLNTSFKYDQDDYWNQESRFEMMYTPLLAQLTNIEDSIGKYLLKAITNFTANVSSDEHNNIIVQELIKYVSNDHENSSQTKIWTIRTLKSIFQKLGENWLSHLPTLVPYIAELLEDDDEAVELEVRKGLVRVIENVLGEPLDRYLD